MKSTPLKITLTIAGVVIVLVGLVLLIRPAFNTKMQNLCSKYKDQLKNVSLIQENPFSGNPLPVWKIEINKNVYLVPAAKYTKIESDSKKFDVNTSITLNANNRLIVVYEHAYVDREGLELIKKMYSYKKDDIQCWPSISLPITDMFLRYALVQHPGAAYVGSVESGSMMIRNEYDGFDISTIYHNKNEGELISYGNIGKHKNIAQIPLNIFYGNFTVLKTPAYIQDAIDALQNRKRVDFNAFRDKYGVILSVKTTSKDSAD